MGRITGSVAPRLSSDAPLKPSNARLMFLSCLDQRVVELDHEVVGSALSARRERPTPGLASLLAGRGGRASVAGVLHPGVARVHCCPTVT